MIRFKRPVTSVPFKNPDLNQVPHVGLALPEIAFNDSDVTLPFSDDDARDAEPSAPPKTGSLSKTTKISGRPLNSASKAGEAAGSASQQATDGHDVRNRQRSSLHGYKIPKVKQPA